MDAIGTLRQDHAHLRKKLALLESVLQAGPEARFVLREMCFSLQRALHEHMERESTALSSLPSEHSGSRSRGPVPDHGAAYHALRAVNELLLGGVRPSLPLIVSRISRAIEELELELELQDETMTGLQGNTESGTAPISGAMSVNEILNRYPRTEGVFEQLHINRLREGYESVDEVAWRHGMDASEFLDTLRRVVTDFPSY